MGTRSIYAPPNTRPITGGVPVSGSVHQNARPGTTPISAPPVKVTKCLAKTKAGRPCKAHPVHGEKYCVGHMKVYGE